MPHLFVIVQCALCPTISAGLATALEVQHDRGPTGSLELHGRRGSRISQKDFGWRNAGAVERRVRADWEWVRKKGQLKVA